MFFDKYKYINSESLLNKFGKFIQYSIHCDKIQTLQKFPYDEINFKKKLNS